MERILQRISLLSAEERKTIYLCNESKAVLYEQYSSSNFSASPSRSVSCMALQRTLGILPRWRTWLDTFDSNHFCFRKTEIPKLERRQRNEKFKK